jgi:hypothetical protein
MRLSIPGGNILALFPCLMRARHFECLGLDIERLRSKGGKGDLQNPFVQIDHVPLTIDQVQVFQGFRKPETLHSVGFLEWGVADVDNSSMSNICSRSFVDVLEHPPSKIPQLYLASDAV